MTITSSPWPGACDTHMHVYEDAYPLAPTATFKPPHAPASAYREVQRELGLTQPAIEHQALETVAQLARLVSGEMPVGAVNPDHADRWRRWRDRQRDEGAP